MVVYVGLFVADEDKEKLTKNEISVLDERVKDFHITIDYKPNDIKKYKRILGKEFKIKVVGYGANKDNSGFLIESPNELLKFYNNFDDENQIKPVHITTSVSKQGKPVDTYKLNFEKIKPFVVKVRAGVVNQEKEVIYDLNC